MNNQPQEALKMAIEALEKLKFEIIYSDEEIEGKNQVSICERQRQLDHNRAINACKEALEAERVCQAQEPVAYAVQDYKEIMEERNGYTLVGKVKDELHNLPLYTHPAPAQEPNCYGDGNVYRGLRSEDSKVKTYYVNTHPHQWQGLTDDEIKTIHNKHIQDDNVFEFARAIEQALKEKNT